MLFGGLVGGCCSRHTYDRLVEEKEISDRPLSDQSSSRSEPDAVSDKWSATRLYYLKESPFTAAFRSFVVYLFLLAGIFLATGDPFKDLGAAGYLRLAGLVSAVAFAVGYDPSRFTELLAYLPKPGVGKTGA